MPNIAKVLKEEISRLARKEAKAAAAPFRKPVVRFRKAAANLKRRVAALEKEAKRLQGLLKKRAEGALAVAPETVGKARITAKGMRSLRKKLRLTGLKFAKLLGVTGQAVYNWERRSGSLKVREKTRAAILAVRDFGAREARQQLAEMAKAKKQIARRRRKRR
jgi:DNA-binding transcriptional regulator YiaG